MSEYVPGFFAGENSKKLFHQVIALHETPDLQWEAVAQTAPHLPRGWYELSRLSLEDRIEFTHEYWASQLPFLVNENEHLTKGLDQFFNNLEDIGIYITQEKQSGPYDVHMVYSLKEETGFFQGAPPASEQTLDLFTKRFGHIHFPPDYLAFLRIHDGFSKYTDTGIIKSRDMAQVYQRLQHLLSEDILISPNGQVIEPEHLIPFYESFGLHCYQCFFVNWHPVEEMGNVYFSENDHSISNFLDPQRLEENLAFASFSAWLIFYLEDIWHL